MNVQDRMLVYMKKGGKLTPLTALAQFHCLSLSQRMGDLKKRGVKVQKGWKKLNNGKMIREYWLL